MYAEVVYPLLLSGSVSVKWSIVLIENWLKIFKYLRFSNLLTIHDSDSGFQILSFQIASFLSFLLVDLPFALVLYLDMRFGLTTAQVKMLCSVLLIGTFKSSLQWRQLRWPEERCFVSCSSFN